MSLSNKEKFLRRKYRVRKNIFGTASVPRLSIFRSLKHIYAQVIDDEEGSTILSASTLTKEIKDKVKGITKKEQAKIVGEFMAGELLKKGIGEVVFDRSGYKYHGRVKELADAARKGGLKF